MKKMILTLVVLAMGLSVTTSAQQSDNTDFKPGLFMGINGGVNLYVGEGNNIFVTGANYNWSLSKSMGYLGRLELGYHFSPIYSLRTMIGLNQFTHYTKFAGVEAQDKFLGENLTADFMINLTNLANGYDANRKLTFSTFAGLGIAYVNDNVRTSKIAGSLLRGGFQANLHINPKFALSLMAGMNLLSDNNNDVSGGVFFDLAPDLSLGFNYNIASKEKSTQVDDKLPMIAIVTDTKKETSTDVEKRVVEPVVIEKKVLITSLNENIFYPFAQTAVDSTAQKVVIAKVVTFMKLNPQAKITVSGHASSATGTDDINLDISRQRAEKVAKELINEYGIEESRIQVKWFGSSVQPYATDNENRVVIIKSDPAK